MGFLPIQPGCYPGEQVFRDGFEDIVGLGVWVLDPPQLTLYLCLLEPRKRLDGGEALQFDGDMAHGGRKVHGYVFLCFKGRDHKTKLKLHI